MNFVVLSSSRGTTFQAVIEAINDGRLASECLGLITDHADRGCVEKARAANIPVVIVEKKQGEDRESYDKRINAAIQQLNNSTTQQLIIACIGWMFLLSPWFVRTWKGKILNVHPSLLPKYPGSHAIADAIAGKETETGMTIHYIDEGLDSGEIIVQKNCSINPNDTEGTVKEKVQALEKEWYPKVLQMMELGKTSLT